MEEMAASVEHWVMAAYRGQEPEVSELAADESPARALQRVIQTLRRRWNKRFTEGAQRLAEWFATGAKYRSDAALKRILKDAGFTIDWRMTRPMNDVMQATIGQQVGLIKSIPEQYLGKVEGMVMRSVQTGRDAKQLYDDIRHEYGLTKKRAALIARDQNAKATATMTRVRQLEAGITHAEWRHSGAGKEPRPTHVAAGRDRVQYEIAKGWYDPHEKQYIWPGTLINCRCTSAPIIKGF